MVAGNQSLEEKLLRVLYEGPASTEECSACGEYGAVAEALVWLARRGYVQTHYLLTPSGSERLAALVETRQ
jgi:hypothetical protein